MPPALNASVSIPSGGFRRFPPVTARPALTEPAAMGARRRLISLMNPAGRLLQRVSALCALSARHFRLDQRPISVPADVINRGRSAAIGTRYRKLKL